MLSKGWLIFAGVAFFFLGLLATLSFLQAFLPGSDNNRFEWFMKLTTCFYLSYLHLHVWMVQEHLKALEEGG